MYSTCLYCTRQLGRNEVLETFPVGRRLAFDAGTGRLWVVCPHCARWNLTPLEERWEAIETCERRFRETRLRASTGNVGLARLREGLELVRIGRPLRPEIAAWRYGDQFGRRRRRQILITGGLLAAAGAAVAYGAVVGVVGLGTLWVLGGPTYRRIVSGSPDRVVARVPMPDGAPLRVRRRHLAFTDFAPSADGRPVLSVRHIATGDHAGGETSTALGGDEALRAAARILPAVNRFGGTAGDVQLAVSRIEHAGSAARYFSSLARTAAKQSRLVDARTSWWHGGKVIEEVAGLAAMPLSTRLAIEMVAHEEQERRALDGELAALEQEWRQADALARIADDLLLPPAARDGLDRLRDAADGADPQTSGRRRSTSA